MEDSTAPSTLDLQAPMIAIVDYGMGNLRSVQNGFARVGATARICDSPGALRGVSKLVLPGVGAFRDAIAELKRRNLVQPVLEHIAADRPFLGVCLGLQLLFDISHEDGRWEGLGVIPGEVVRFPSPTAGGRTANGHGQGVGVSPKSEIPDPHSLKVPHMGWNTLEVVGDPPLLRGIPHDAAFYFVHSYYVVPADEAVVAARTEHGEQFVSAIARGNLFATQFHPEKSQRYGLQLLRNFAAM